MLDAIGHVLTNPVTFFRDLAAKEGGAGGAFWVVLITALVSAVSGYLLVLPQLDAFGSESAFAQFALVGGVAGAALGPFFGWLIYGLLARIGAGIAARPWAVTGYAMAPQIVLGVLTIVIIAIFPVEVTPVVGDLSDPQALTEATNRLQRELGSSVAGRGSTILSYLGTAWLLALVFLGLRETTGERAKAIRGTVLVGAFFAVFALVPFLLSAPG